MPNLWAAASQDHFGEVSRRPSGLHADWNIAAEVWSATSFSELAREAREAERF